MSLRERIKADLTAAMKSQDAERTAALRLIRAEILKLEKSGKGEPDDADVVRALQRLLNQSQDAAAQFEAAGRVELAAKERAEAVYIQSYLPAALSDEEIDALIAAVLAETGAATMKDMGRVMGAVLARVKATGKTADGAAVNAKVKARLGG